MKTLEQIGREQFTEKADQGFLSIYERLWKDLKDKPITLLEIGIYNGNSLRTWCEWFPNATIIGIDYNPNNPMRTDRALLHFGNQKDAFFLRTVAGEYDGFDIIIDDGGHKWDEQQISFNVLWPYINPGGMYIIEDLQTSTDSFWGAEGFSNTIDFLKNMVYGIIINKDYLISSIEFHYRLAVIHKPV